MVLMSKRFLFAIFQGAFVLSLVLVQAQDKSGFISIDCGTSDGSSYTDEETGITYLSDSNFTDAGENRYVTPAYRLQTGERQFWNVRSFPQGTKNCYTLKPSQGKDTRYLIRARFMYGNYDNESALPEFDLYLGANLWDTVEVVSAQSIINKEIVHVPSSDHPHVCLVNTGLGVPFISVLELRPWNNRTYVTTTGSLQLYRRFDFASKNINRVMRYKDDVYDRLWSPFYADIWRPLNISFKDENSISKNVYGAPFTVMSTAYTRNRSTSYMGIHWNSSQSTFKYYFYMHFVELEKLGNKQSREFNIYINGKLWYGPFAPAYLNESTIYSTSGITPDSEGKVMVLLNKTENSTLPPLMNAMEVYVLKELLDQETNQTDAQAVLNIKSEYELKRDWQGDPCTPKAYSWEGLVCSSNITDLPRIISLNLSSSGLKGEISPYLADLTMLQYLDLSNNSLSGKVPEFLAELSFLRVLSLKGNNLTGPIPAALLERSKNGLSLSVDTNVIGNETSSSPSNETSSASLGYLFGKKKSLFQLVASAGSCLLYFVL
ncbi:hypothetical protein TIFTF001_006526 [Ficus carica]|uniref:Malectin-like domain-containing protein n=1 Tax=Ficus carica TaxID=3494 RepID=A0AA87ZN08_FICCA|nr:hypothetical protein TIFTF001_006526 [Ficus carica]